MARYSVQPKDRIFVKGYYCFSLLKICISKSISKNVSSKFSQKRIDHAKHFTINEVKATSKRAIQKTAVATNDSIENKIVDEITRISKTSQKNNPEANEEDVLRERYTSSDQRQKIIDDLRLI